jgi:hypothetical protein
MQKIFKIVPAILIAAAFGVPAAHAGMVTFNISGADTGTITFVESGGTITGVSGSFDGSPVSTVLATGGIGGNDNLYYSTPPYLDNRASRFS